MTIIRRLGVFLFACMMAFPFAFAPSAAHEKDALPIALVFPQMKFEVREAKQGELRSVERLNKAIQEGKPSQRAIKLDYSNRWIECDSESCYCTGKRDCGIMTGQFCDFPPDTFCGILSTGKIGCICTAGQGRGRNANGSSFDDRIAEPEFIYP